MDHCLLFLDVQSLGNHCFIHPDFYWLSWSGGQNWSLLLHCVQKQRSSGPEKTARGPPEKGGLCHFILVGSACPRSWPSWQLPMSYVNEKLDPKMQILPGAVGIDPGFISFPPWSWQSVGKEPRTWEVCSDVEPGWSCPSDPSERPSLVVLFSAGMTALESLSHARRRREKLILCSRELSLENYTGKLTFKGTKGTIL